MSKHKTFYRTFDFTGLLLQLISIYLFINCCVVFTVQSFPVFVPNSVDNSNHETDPLQQNRLIDKRQSPKTVGNQLVNNDVDPQIYGFRAEGDSSDQWVDSISGLTTVKLNSEVSLRVFGQNLNALGLLVALTTTPPETRHCNPRPDKQWITDALNSHSSSTAKIRLSEEGTYYLCYSNGPANKSGNEWYYVDVNGSEFFQIQAKGPLIPLWVQIMLIIILLCLSGLFSGLNLGLMALDKNELKVIARCGTEQEKFYAKQIAPVRKRGNYLLCTLLFGNVLVNSTLTIFLDDLSSGIIAVVVSTLSIVVFGEIIPQALCSRHGLAVGARTVWLTYIFMVATFPLSYPISLILDRVLGEEIGNVYDRERLMEYIRVTKDHNRLDADEVNIISGALKLSKIRVTEIMTQINDVFMVPYNTILNFQTMTEINDNGYSRIPVYDNDRNNVIGILHAKDLAFTDPDQNMPIKALLEFYKHPLYFVYEDVTLDIMLNEFKQGKSHMAFVRKIIDDGVNDPVYELAGVVTLEDVIEELIQAEINDETDVISDNRRKQKRKEVSNRPNYSDFLRLGGQGQESGVKIVSSQLLLAGYRYLSTFVEPFTSEFLSERVLKILMSKKIYYDVKVNPNKQFDTIHNIPANCKLYSFGKPADYFILILEGRVKVIIGKENQSFDSGPFSHFGISALKVNDCDTEAVTKSISLGRLSISDYNTHQIPNSSPESVLKTSASTVSTAGYRCSISEGHHLLREGSFVPDYTVYCIENTSFMKVTRATYLAAIRSTIMERQNRTDGTDQQFEDHMDSDGGINFSFDINHDSSHLLSPSAATKQSNPSISGRSVSNVVSTDGTSGSNKQTEKDTLLPSAGQPPPPNYEETIKVSNSGKSLLKNEIQNTNHKQLTHKKSNESIDSFDNKLNSSQTDECKQLI